MNEQEAHALWDRLAADFQRDHWTGAVRAALPPKSPLMQDFYRINNPSRTQAEYESAITLYGLPVRIDPTLPPNEIRLEGADGTLVRMVNIGDG